MDKGTLISIIAVLIATTNQVLVLLGKSPILIDSTLIEQIVSAIFTIITIIVAWFKRKKKMADNPKKNKNNKN
ncbi:phage holin [Oceanobacillus sp. J11TS1]|uniref:phage holin n=1 Tax=Oceanobacillus sp. J11TS1 TaxID=2807191 RepID=UPI001B2A38D9|nr:phage holin [Oceanobacillus sp. J11TS1]GIO21702.1 hypothetical protein J11TS1_02830 [Oceanobacillus sp. J11TS1]